MGTREDQLNEFLSHLDKSLTRIQNLCSSTHDGQCRSFKKALLFTFIDNLSTLAYPGARSDSKKVKKLLIDYGHWKDGDRVSTPHLCRWIELNPEGLLPLGNEKAKGKLSQWETGCLVPISSDPDIASIMRLSNPENANTAIALNKMTHFSLLWNQRHNLLHRFTSTGVNLEFPDDVSPYYIGLTSIKDSASETQAGSLWQLIYPTGFLFALARACIEGVTTKLQQESLDIRAHYKAGFYLLEELNQPHLN
jgi:hypothetical protein